MKADTMTGFEPFQKITNKNTFNIILTVITLFFSIALDVNIIGNSLALADPPVANITMPADGSEYHEDFPVIFMGTGEDVEDGTLTGTSLVWEFLYEGPWTIGTGTYVRIRPSDYPMFGSETFRLTVTDSGGATSIDEVTIDIFDEPTPAWIEGIVRDAQTNEEIAGAVIISSDDVSATSYPDGFYVMIHPEGTFMLTAKAAGYFNKTISGVDVVVGEPATQDIYLEPDTEPAASIIFPSADETVKKGDVVYFRGSDTGGDAPFTYIWDFDGGADNSSSKNPGYVTFSTEGVYNVVFTVIDAQGDTHSDSVTVTVTVRDDPPNKPILQFPSNGETNVPLNPTLQTGSFSDPNSKDTHFQTYWQISTDTNFSTTLHAISSEHLTSLIIPHLALKEGTTYYWRAQFYDDHLNASGWSDAFHFSTLTTANDQNGNGIPDDQENDTVDLDNDGIPDIQQDHIKSLNTVVGNGQMGVSIKNFPNVTSIESIESIDHTTISPTTIPYNMALGLFAFSIHVANPGDSVQVTVYFSQAAPVNARWFKYDSIEGWQDYSDHATFSADRKSVILELQDGGIGDADGAANGVIVDPGGFGLASWIEGFVSDASTGEGVSSAKITILDLVIKTLSDGHYLSMMLPGTYSSTVSASGYETVTETIVVDEGSILSCNYQIASDESGGGSVNVYYPHIASNSTWETEIGIINTGSQTFGGEMKAYSNSGQLIDSKSINLTPYARREIIVGDEFFKPNEIVYIVFASDSQTVDGYLKFYVDGKYRVAVPAALNINTGDIYISHIASDDNWTTGISVLNTKSSSKELTIEFDNGTTITRTIVANGHQEFTVRDLFEGVMQENINSGVIKNGSGIVGLEIFGTTDTSGLNLLSGILINDNVATNIYYPHISSDSTWSTGIVAYNPSQTSCVLTITPYSSDGISLSNQTVTLSGKEKYIGTPESLNLPTGTAWFSIEASSHITGFELFSTKDGNQLGGYTVVDINGTDGIFAKIDDDGGTGIALVNIENSAATVMITAYNDSGIIVANESFNLKAYEKIVDMPSNLFSQNISSATYIAYSSDRQVVGFQLNVSSDGMMLDAMPGM